ncbi:MAG: hypothetical protein IKO73_00975 [Bacteroidaceae bacterium]|nr:hypothetical protein [Bacteroidaceae bacterium]
MCQKKNLQRIVHVIILLVLCSSIRAENTAEESPRHQTYPYMFLGIQGGMQTTFSKGYSTAQLITPTASVSFGAFFTPYVGTRLHVNGIWDKGGYAGNGVDFQYHYKYSTINLDMMINLVNLICRRTYSAMNVYFINGFGLNMAWGNGDACTHKDVLPYAYENTCFSHNIRLGLMVDYNFAKNFCINIEIDGNNLRDRFNSKLSNHSDWQLTAQLGVAYKFGHKK